MRFIRGGLLALVLLLAACGTPTDNSVPADDSTGSQPSGAASASPAASTAPEASASPAGGEGAVGTDPVERNDMYSAAPALSIDANKKYTATIETTKGTMTAELYAQEVPKTVNNFVFLARENFYQNVKFHRIIKDFMIQGGDPTGTGAGGPGYQFEDEPIPASLSYTRGTLAMANAGPNTNGSQFFIMHADYPLPKNYTIFGKLTAGEDVLDTIANTPTTGAEGSTPTEDIRIVNVTIAEE
ncbi:MAG TPA: peptidylprolyl isomerase [Herpetosiphonaceae bacterium]